MNTKSLLFKEYFMIFFFITFFVIIFYYNFILCKVYIWEDLLYGGYPACYYLSTRIASGGFPFWASGLNNGMPFYTDIALAYAYPLNLLLTPFALSGHLPFQAYQVIYILNYILAGIFMFIFLKSYSLDDIASLIGSIIYVFSGYSSLHFVHQSFIQTIVLLPLSLYFTKKIFDDKNIKYYFFLIISILFSFIAGSSQITLYSSYYIILYWLFLYFLNNFDKNNIGKSLSFFIIEIFKIGVIFIAVILLGAFLFLPSIENWYLSYRQSFGFKEIADQSLPWYYIIHAFFPNFFGTSFPSNNIVNFWGFNKDTIEYATWHAGHWQYWEFGFYSGQISLIGLLYFLSNYKKTFKNSHIAFFCFMVFLSLWFMLGRYGGLFNVLYYIIPGIKIFRTPARMAFAFDFSMAVIGAYYINEIISNKSENFKKILKPILFILGFYILFLVLFILTGQSWFIELQNPDNFNYALKQIFLAILIIIILLVLIFIYYKFKDIIFKNILLYIISIIIFLDFYLVFSGFHKGTVNPDEYYNDRYNIIPYIQDLQKSKGLFRFAQLRYGIISEEIIFPRNYGLMNKDYEAPEGYVLFQLKDMVNFKKINNQKAKLDIQNIGLYLNLTPEGATLNINPDCLPRVKFFANIKVFNNNDEILKSIDNGELNYQNTIGVLKSDIENNRIIDNNIYGNVNIIKINPENYKIEYDIPCDGVIFISQTFYPGWEVFDDNGNKYKIIKVFGAFTGIIIQKPGKGVLYFKFIPKIFYIGILISAITLIILVSLIIIFNIFLQNNN